MKVRNKEGNINLGVELVIYNNDNNHHRDRHPIIMLESFVKIFPRDLIDCSSADHTIV